MDAVSSLPTRAKMVGWLEDEVYLLAQAEAAAVHAANMLASAETLWLIAEDEVYLAHPDPKTLGANERLREAVVRTTKADAWDERATRQDAMREAQSALRVAQARLSVARAIARLVAGAAE